jgi:hypothetical protein
VIVAAGVALAVLILGVLWLSTGMFRGTQESPEATASPTTVARSAPVPPPSPTPATGKVVLTAKNEVWMRVYDGANKTLFTGTLQPGQTFEVPVGTDRPMLNIGRPDQLQVTVDGRALPPLGDGKRAMKDVGVSAEALAVRFAGPSAPAVTPSASSSPTPAASGAAVPPAFQSSGG